MESRFSNRVRDVISLSREEALRLGHDYIGTEHLLLGMIREGEGVAIGLLKKLGVSIDELKSSIEQATKGTASENVKNQANIPLTRQSEKVLKITYLEAKIFKSVVREISTFRASSERASKIIQNHVKIKPKIKPNIY